MANSDFFINIAQELREVVRPLEEALESPIELAVLLREHGWHIDGDATAAVDLIAQRLEFATRLPTLESAVSEVVGSSSVSPQDALALLRSAQELLLVIKTLGTGPPPPGAIAPLDQQAFWSTLGVDLTQTLFATYLERCHPTLFAALHLTGVIDSRHIQSDGTPGRIGYTRTEIHWDRLSLALTDPAQLAIELYNWGGELHHEKLTNCLQRVFYAFGIPATLRLAEHPLIESFFSSDNSVLATLREVRAPLMIRREIDGERIEFGVLLLPIPPQDDPNGLPIGVLIGPYAEGEFGAQIPLGGFFELEFKGGWAADATLGLELRPGSAIPRLSEASTIVDAGMTLIGAPFRPWIPVGQEDGHRVEVHDVALGLELRGESTDPEVRLKMRTSRIDLVVDLADGDGFLQSLFGAKAHTFTAAGALVWSSKRGLAFEGSGTLTLNLNIDRSIAGVSIVLLSLAIHASQRAVTLSASLTAIASIGPVIVAIEGVGIELLLDRVAEGQQGNFGDLDLSFGFKQPSGMGLSIDASVIVGGGALSFNQQKQEYGGILQLQILEKISVTGMVLLSTRMPDGKDGFALVVIIFVEGFAPIQLGFGFALTGIGGLLAINRTFDEEALRQGLKDKTLDSLMFPKDVIRTAPQILSNISKVFPPAEDHYLFGPMVQLAWGTPALITAELAVVLEFGERLRLLILAQIEAILPTRDNDLVCLRMDAVGVIDFDQSTASIDATLRGSHLLKKFLLTGDMAMRLRWGSDPNFALAVGGLHYAFNPPANFPKLERLTLNLSAGDNPRLRCEAYFALTPNTLQFGARAELYASAIGFTVQGHIGFDVLIQRDPFYFLAEFDAQLQLKRGSKNLFKVRVEGSLEGPRPLHIKAKASFEILWWDVSFRVNKTLFEGELPPLPNPVNVLPLLREALSDQDNWTTHLPDNQRPVVTLRAKHLEATEIWLHPLGSLTVKQNVVPLNLDISRFGSAVPADASRFKVRASLDQGSANDEPVQEFFAPAQFIEMSDDQKLARPSFEKMDAGVSFGSELFGFPKETDWLEVKTIDFETRIIDEQTKVARSGDPMDANGQRIHYQLSTDLLDQQSRFGAAANSELRRSGKTRYRTTIAKHRVAKEEWIVIRTDNLEEQLLPGVEAERVVSYSEADQSMQMLIQEDPSKARNLKILRRSELATVESPDV